MFCSWTTLGLAPLGATHDAHRNISAEVSSWSPLLPKEASARCPSLSSQLRALTLAEGQHTHRGEPNVPELLAHPVQHTAVAFPGIPPDQALSR